MRDFLIECMSDGIWHASVDMDGVPEGASDTLAKAAYEAIPAEIRARIEAEGD